MQKNSSYILATKLSDHLPCILSFEIEPKPRKKPKYITKIDKSPENQQKYIEGLIYEISSISNFNRNLLNNPNKNYNKLDKIINDCHEINKKKGPHVY